MNLYYLSNIFYISFKQKCWQLNIKMNNAAHLKYIVSFRLQFHYKCVYAEVYDLACNSTTVQNTVLQFLLCR